MVTYRLTIKLLNSQRRRKTRRYLGGSCQQREQTSQRVAQVIPDPSDFFKGCFLSQVKLQHAEYQLKMVSIIQPKYINFEGRRTGEIRLEANRRHHKSAFITTSWFPRMSQKKRISTSLTRFPLGVPCRSTLENSQVIYFYQAVLTDRFDG